MRDSHRLWLIIFLAPWLSWAQETRPVTVTPSLSLDPAVMGFRYDDNVLRTVTPSSRLSDEIYSMNWGGSGSLEYDLFRLDGSYQVGGDQYQLYSNENNLRNNLSFTFGVDPAELSASYRKSWFWRTSDESNYSYFENGNYLDLAWLPKGPWGIFGEFYDYSRHYDDASNAFQSRDYMDQAFNLALQREVNDQISFKVEGGYNARQFNRTVVVINGPVTSILPDLQVDRTWFIRASGHLYIESVLQDFRFEHQRTDSNSYGFSNSVDSVSWAAVLKPGPSFYLQLFFRLYSKVYDSPPILGNPDLQIGYVDEDSQDLLAIKTTWEWAPQWSLNLGISRLRTESTQPSLFYIKDIFSIELQKDF